MYFSVLRREVALHDACRKNDVDAVKKILSDKIDINCRNNVGTELLSFNYQYIVYFA